MIMSVRRCDAVPLRSGRSRHQKQHLRNAIEPEEKQAHPIHLTDRIEQNGCRSHRTPEGSGVKTCTRME